MKRLMLATATILALYAPAAYAAEHDHSAQGGHEAGMTHSGNAAHEEVLDGVKATFTVQTMADAMKAMGMEMPKGVRETHHISLSLKNLKSGKTLTEGDATIKVLAPDKSEQTKGLMAMHGHFGADFVMGAKGTYGVMCKFKASDGKVRQAKFRYTVK